MLRFSKRFNPFIILIMLVFGKNQVEELLKFGGKIKTLYIRNSLKPQGIIKNFIENNPDAVKVVSKADLKKISQNEKARDVIAILEEFDYYDALDVINMAKERRGIVLYLDHIEDPVNLGAIIRSAAAFSVTGIIIPKNRACKITPTVIRVSEGFVFKVPISIITNPLNFIKIVKKEGIFITSLEREGYPLSKVTFPRPLLLIAGSEGKGVSRKIIEASDIVASIEQSKDVNSLNVHVAVSIALWKSFIENLK